MTGFTFSQRVAVLEMVEKLWDLQREVLEGEVLLYLERGPFFSLLIIIRSIVIKEKKIFSCS